MKFKALNDIDDVRSAYRIIKELREHLDEAAFLELYQQAVEESQYTLVAGYENEICVGLIGFRTLTDFVHGRHLYIDDLVVSENYRSKGHGKYFLDYADQVAKERSCKKIRLCTGIQNDRGKSFYERNGLSVRAVVYKKSLV